MAKELVRGAVDNVTIMKIFDDGTFTTRHVFGKDSARDRLVAFSHDADSMRRKSAAGRGGAAFLTAGLSLAASNNRGVFYVTVTGEQTGVRTYTTRNPSGTTLSSVRSLQAAADSVLAAGTSAPPTGDLAGQLKSLTDLHAAGALSDAEFAAAKARLLS